MRPDPVSTVLLIPAAGSGTRLAAGVPKAFVPLAGRSLLAHAVEGAVRSGVIDAIVIAAPSSLVEDARRIAETAAEAPAGSADDADDPDDPDGSGAHSVPVSGSAPV
ncbi:MAG: 2-C-methyl-D-erythritol 4-phosphate cytidylyltransferase, partial [Brevibacterium yomogidense]